MFIIVFAISLGLPLIIQEWLRRTYTRWGNIGNTANLTGAQVAEMMLRANNVYDVQVEPVRGKLTDHYDPRAKAVRLSEGNYARTSVAAMAVAAHEVGHAIQHAQAYRPLQWRTALLMPAQLGQNFGPILVVIGASIGSGGLGMMQLGIVLFLAAALFQLVTLPIEFDASRRALAEMKRLNIVSDQDTSGSFRVLRAAAMTYVAGLASTVAFLMYYIMMYLGQRDE